MGARGAAGVPPSDVPPLDSGPAKPNPLFKDLPDNTAIDLGRYECASRVPDSDLRCEKITDFSRLNYDPYNHRILMFGGGHAATGRTDVDVFDLSTLTWSSLYPSMSCDDVAAKRLDPRGFHLETGHPVARHTYDMNVIAEVGGVGRMLMLSTEGFSGHCHRYHSSIRSVAHLPLTSGHTTWEYSDQFSLPWYYAASAEFDPPSGQVVVMGSGRGASAGGLWVYDPETSEIVASVYGLSYGTLHHDLVYFPPNQKHYLFAGRSVYEVTLDRDSWKASVSELLTTSGTASPGHGYAYDANSRLIVGGISEGIAYRFNPATRSWASEAITVRSKKGASIGTTTYKTIDYDPVNNIFIIIADGPEGRRTWAYRYRR